MGKKKQEDFQKTKLRPGRRLPKGKNVTNTAFKAKKIITREPKLNKDLGERFKDTLSRVEHHNASERCEALNKIKAYVQDNAEEMVADIPDILGKVIKVIYDIESLARQKAIGVIKVILKMTTDMQVKCFFPLLTSNLTCAMTSTDFQVRKDSLELLNVMLETHPNLICHSFCVLGNLLDMISCLSKRKEVVNKRRILLVTLNNQMTSQEWRIKVMTCLSRLLQAVLASMNKLNENDEDEHEVYWDGKTPLYLPIYTCGGIKPLEVKHTSTESALNYCWKPEVVKDLVSDTVPLLSDIFNEEIAEFSSCLTNGYVLSPQAVESVKTVFEVFATLGEWIKLIANSDNELHSWFASEYGSIICYALMKGFPYSVHSTSTKSKNSEQPPCVQINLANCYLYTAFVLETCYASEDTQTKVLLYLKDVFTMEYESRLNYIPVLLKIADNYLHLSSTNIDIINALLTGICTAAKVPYSSSSRNLLFCFFRKLTLDPQYRNIQKAQSMKFWFQILLNELNEMKSTNNVDKKILKDVKKICTLKFPTFMETLKKISPDQMLKLLEYPNIEFQDTIIHLITYMDKISSDFLQAISEVMLLNTSFSLRTITRLIRRLYHRFSAKNISPFDCMNFWKFLLNTACGTVFINETKWAEEENAEFSSAWQAVQEISPFDIVPNSVWNRHSTIFEVCIECLTLFPDEEKIAVLTMYFLKTFLLSNSKLPVHTVIAVLRLKHKISQSNCVLQNEDLDCIIYDLMYSSLLYLSIITHQVLKEDWHLHSVDELEDSLDLDRKSIFHIIKAVENTIEGCSDDGLFYVLKILKYFIIKQLLIPEDRMKVMCMLRMIQEVGGEGMVKDPLWADICNFFGS